MEYRKDIARSKWLSARGFVIDPFMPEAYRAETDELFELSGLPSYVDKIDILQLMGNFESPGYHFIFAPSGGGKSSLQQRIHLEHEQLVTTSKALVIDYLDHNYSYTRNSVHEHIKRIIRMAEDVAAVKFREVKRQVKDSPVLALKMLVRTCKKLGFSGIYVLVDNLVDIHTFQKIEPLIGETAIFDIKGFVPKFFLPDNFLLIAQSSFPFTKYPPYILTWDRSELLKVLNQRLIACVDPLFITSNTRPVLFLFEEHQNLAAKVEDVLVKLGQIGNAPRLMWQMGNYLIEEHINGKKSSQGDDLISNETFARARLRLFDDLLESKKIIDHRIGSDLNFEHKQIVKVPTGRKPKARIFLCYAEKDEQLVYEDLYQELQARNYQPWMRREVFPGEKRNYAIKSAIEKSDFVIICLSSRSTKERGDFQKELKWAQNKQEEMKNDDIYVIPVRLEKCVVPDDLEQWHADWFIENQRTRLFLAFEEGKTRRRRK